MIIVVPHYLQQLEPRLGVELLISVLLVAHLSQTLLLSGQAQTPLTSNALLLQTGSFEHRSRQEQTSRAQDCQKCLPCQLAHLSLLRLTQAAIQTHHNRCPYRLDQPGGSGRTRQQLGMEDSNLIRKTPISLRPGLIRLQAQADKPADIPAPLAACSRRCGLELVDDSIATNDKPCLHFINGLSDFTLQNNAYAES